jgi:FMN-dependent NADH-azoreductase
MPRTVENLLLLTSSIKGDTSVSTRIARRLADKLAPGGYVTRDLGAGVPMIDGAWLGAAFTPEGDRTPEQVATIALSEELIAELKAADTVVIGVPIYNFAPSTHLKAWFDHVARAGITFRYTETGPEGLLPGKKAYLAMASAGTGLGSPIDFATPWLRHMLGFMGISDVEAVAADKQAGNGDAEAEALATVDRLTAAA